MKRSICPVKTLKRHSVHSFCSLKSKTIRQNTQGERTLNTDLKSSPTQFVPLLCIYLFFFLSIYIYIFHILASIDESHQSQKPPTVRFHDSLPGMSPALLDTRAPAYTYIHTEGHSLQNPIPDGQLSDSFTFTFSGFSSNNQLHAMNSSNANNVPYGIRNSNEINNSPGVGSGKPVYGSASGLSKPRLTKRRQTSSHHPRLTPESETSKIDPGFNQYISVSDNTTRFPFGLEMGNSTFGKVDERAFVFGGNRSNASLDMNSGMGNSTGNVGNAILDEMRKLKIASGKDFTNTDRNSASGFDESLVSKLPDEIKKLNFEGSGIVESSNNAKDMNADLSANNKSHFSFESADNNVANFLGRNVVSELPNVLKKLNIKDPGQVDGGSLFSNADVSEKFVSGNTSSDYLARSSTTLPNKMKHWNGKDSLNTGVGGKKDVNVNTGDKGSFVFGSGISTSSSLGEKTENLVSDEMGKLKIGSEAAETAGQTQKVFSSSRFSVKEMQQGNLCDSIPTEFTFQAGVQSKSLSGIQVPLDYRDFDMKSHRTIASSSSSFPSGGIGFQEVGNVSSVPSMDGSEKDGFSFTSKRDDAGTSHVGFKTPTVRRNLYSSSNPKLEHSAKESIKDPRSKKKRGKSKKPTLVQPWFGQDFISRESSSHENQESSEAYSPMDVSPYPETVADIKCSRETSVTSDESFHLDVNHTSGGSDTIPMVSDDITNEDLVFATQCLDINEVDARHAQTKEEECFDKIIGAEGAPEESVSGAETESFKSATEQFDNISDTSVTSGEPEVSSSSKIGRKDSDDRMQFCFSSSSDDTGGINFTFAASSSTEGQLSAAARHLKKKNRVKAGHDAYNSTPNAKLPHASSSGQFFPFSGASSFLSSGQGKKGDASTSLSKAVNESLVVKELEIKQETRSIPAASVAAQEACEKCRLRGNQAYAKGDLSKAEDYYTQGINCVSQSETSRSCLKALMLCYSNRAATRMSLGRMREALGDCMMAGAIDPNFVKVQVRAASCYLALGDVEDASLHFNKFLQSGSDACVDRKLLVEASEGLQKAQKVSECMSQSADLLRRRTSSDAESALEVIAEALTISSYSEKFNEMKAEALFMLRKYEDVIQWCEQTLSVAKMNSPALGADGDLEQLNGSDIQQIPSFSLWRWRLIFKAYFYLGRLEEALDFLKKQEESRCGSKSLEIIIPLAGTMRELLHHKAAGNEAFQSGRHSEAVEHYTSALSCNVESRPFSAICFCNRAAAYRSLGQITDAIADCSLAIALDGNYLKAISRRATLYEMIRDYGQAAIDLQRLVFLLTKQVEEKASYSGQSDRMSRVNELRQAQLRLSEMEEEARKEIPLNMYLILGLEPSVAASEIKKAYRKSALRHHPDKAGQSLARSENGDDGLWKEVAEEVHKDADRLFKMIGEAYAVLSDPAKRSRYDLDEEIRNTSKRGSGINTSRTHTDVPNYSFERSGSRRQWQEVWRSYGKSQSRGSETTRSNRYT